MSVLFLPFSSFLFGASVQAQTCASALTMQAQEPSLRFELEITREAATTFSEDYYKQAFTNVESVLGDLPSPAFIELVLREDPADGFDRRKYTLSFEAHKFSDFKDSAGRKFLDYGVLYHEFGHAIFETALKKLEPGWVLRRENNDDQLMMNQLSNVGARWRDLVEGYHEFFADVLAVVTSGNPAVNYLTTGRKIRDFRSFDSRLLQDIENSASKSSVFLLFYESRPAVWKLIENKMQNSNQKKEIIKSVFLALQEEIQYSTKNISALDLQRDRELLNQRLIQRLASKLKAETEAKPGIFATLFNRSPKIENSPELPANFLARQKQFFQKLEAATYVKVEVPQNLLVKIRALRDSARILQVLQKIGEALSSKQRFIQYMKGLTAEAIQEMQSSGMQKDLQAGYLSSTAIQRVLVRRFKSRGQQVFATESLGNEESFFQTVAKGPFIDVALKGQVHGSFTHLLQFDFVQEQIRSVFKTDPQYFYQFLGQTREGRGVWNKLFDAGPAHTNVRLNSPEGLHGLIGAGSAAQIKVFFPLEKAK